MAVENEQPHHTAPEARGKSTRSYRCRTSMWVPKDFGSSLHPVLPLVVHAASLANLSQLHSGISFW